MPDPLADQDALAVLKRLRAAGHEALFAGGCVRDLLMGQLAQDYDVATSASPEQVRGLFKQTQAVGAAFGVILVREGSSTIEVATFRTDLEYEDGRHPTGVKFATAEEDARRRDFTINGLFFDPVDNRIIDYVGGQADLTARRLSAIGTADERFAEDHLRMLRAVRFASRFGFEIELQTALAIQSHTKEIIRISPERIAEELRKMLTPPSRIAAYQLLKQFGFIPILMRFLPGSGASGSDGDIGLFRESAGERPISFGLALAFLMLDFRLNVSNQTDPRKWLAPREIKLALHGIRQALKISNEETNEMSGSLAFGQLLGDALPTVAMLKRFLNQSYSSDAIALMTALTNCGFFSERIESVLASLDLWRQTDFAPAPLITGDDLTAAGARPGPKFKAALDAAYDEQLEGKIATKTQAMDLALQVMNLP